MLQIDAQQLGKRYRYEWIFKDLEYSFLSGNSYALAGPNGSGKSTLLKVLSSFLTPSKGEIQFSYHQKSITPDQVAPLLSFAAPYTDLIEEWTLTEAIQFHFRFKTLKEGLELAELPALFQLEKAIDKPVRFFSSGMKQRLRLGLAFVAKSELLLLDEPTSNLDEKGMQWYRTMINRFTGKELLVVASNVAIDFDFCNHRVNIMDYKPRKRNRLAGTF